ncbi:MAG: Asp-tRNA(Asn)/Glu-tRNA(Gln) amidotransferase subunit GatB, partial [Candidatus Krumholzibacteria bacterium]|nr:Asp-tRNA(Asn)/Glu-tRNA(Gln) amidotransferase subunit GatB [Candidatus Krumholzibacteria bacterium]
PKNYQISQYEAPLCTGGSVTIESGKRIGITRIHLEEDAGKLVHGAADNSLVDMNRCGVPLIEIVSEPDMRTPAQAREYVQELRAILRYLDICDGNMEEGSLRCDVNVSLREKGSTHLGVKTEIKNVNSFKFVEQALTFEIDRQNRVLSGGGQVERDTLLWDARCAEAQVMRAKEASHDYRYFPEPDLPVLRVPESQVQAVAQTLPELPDARRDRFVGQFGLPAYDARVLTASRELADYFEAVASATNDAKAASNWVMGDVLRELKERSLEVAELAVAPEELARLIGMLKSGRINTPTAREVFKEMVGAGASAEDVVASRGLEQLTDADAIGAVATQVIDANPDALKKYLDGKHALLKFFVGQVMKTTQGKANPQQAETILKSLLEDRRPPP